jgi:hypothetical protein
VVTTRRRGSSPDWSGAVALLVAHTPHLWALALVFFGAGDLVTTVLGVEVGRAVELGPVATLVFPHGYLWLVGLKATTIGGAYLLWRLSPEPHGVGIPLGLATLGVLVSTWNAAVLFATLP